jgi:hypothetical protein
MPTLYRLAGMSLISDNTISSIDGNRHRRERITVLHTGFSMCTSIEHRTLFCGNVLMSWFQTINKYFMVYDTAVVFEIIKL